MWSADLCENCARKIMDTPHNWPRGTETETETETPIDAPSAPSAPDAPSDHNHQEGVICEKCDTSAAPKTPEAPKRAKPIAANTEIVTECARPIRYTTTEGGDWIDWPEGYSHPAAARTVEFQDGKVFDVYFAPSGLLRGDPVYCNGDLCAPTHYKERITGDWQVWPYTEVDTSGGIHRSPRPYNAPIFAIKFQSGVTLSLADMAQGFLLVRPKS